MIGLYFCLTIPYNVNMYDFMQYIFPNEQRDLINKLEYGFYIKNNHIFFMKHNEEIASIIKYAKYGKYPASFMQIGLIMGGILKSKKVDGDIIVFVPMHKIDEQKRGFNQSMILAKAISSETGIKLCTNALIKKRRTKKQASLTGVMRRYSQDGVFKAYDQLTAGKKILLVDDIFTTGSTLNECKKELIDKGASEVIFITVSRNEKLI